MGTISPVLDLWMEKETGRLLISSYALSKEYGAPMRVGDLRPVDNQEFMANGIDIVLEDLRGFAKRGICQHALEAMTQREEAAFCRRHLLVGILLASRRELVVCPMVRTRGGHMGKDDEAAKFKVSLGNEKFYEVVMEMFDKCE
jgi:hypothetical protein